MDIPRREFLPILAAAMLSSGEVQAQNQPVGPQASEPSELVDVMCIVDAINRQSVFAGEVSCAVPVDQRDTFLALSSTTDGSVFDAPEAQVGSTISATCDMYEKGITTFVNCALPAGYQYSTDLGFTGLSLDGDVKAMTIDDVNPIDLDIDVNGDGHLDSREMTHTSAVLDFYYNIISGEVEKLESTGVEISPSFKKAFMEFTRTMLELRNPYHQAANMSLTSYKAGELSREVRNQVANLLIQLHLQNPDNADFARKLRRLADDQSLSHEDYVEYMDEVLTTLNIPSYGSEPEKITVRTDFDNMVSPAHMSVFYGNRPELEFALPSAETAPELLQMIDQNQDIMTLVSGNTFLVKDPRSKGGPMPYVLGNDGYFYCFSLHGGTTMRDFWAPKTLEQFEAYLQIVREVK